MNIHIEQAAAGCVDGTLKDWPLLLDAMRTAGITNAQPSTPGFEAADMCRDYLSMRAQHDRDR